MFKKSTLEPNILLTGIHQLLDINITSPPATVAKVIAVLMSKHQYISMLVWVERIKFALLHTLVKSWWRGVNVVYRC